jgi:hypothetical protein
MELTLVRRYFPDGTNGNLWLGDRLVCHTIELPWLNNQRNISCIPEGRYLLKARYTEERGWHYEISGVENRSCILFHPANHALKELKGCIAPVSQLSGYGRGLKSRRANENLKFLVKDAMDNEEEVSLIIKNVDHGGN